MKNTKTKFVETKLRLIDMKRLLTVMMLMFVFFSTGAQEKIVHHFYTQYTDADGLFGLSISSCCKDDFGRMWLGSREGVYYFDGNGFTRLSNEVYLADSHGNISLMAKDNDNCIWMIASSGSGYYDIEKETYINIESLANLTITDLNIDADGNIWFTSSEGLWMYSKISKELTKIKGTEDLSLNKSCIIDNNIIVSTNGTNKLITYNHAQNRIIQSTILEESASFSMIQYMGDSKFLTLSDSRQISIIDINDGSIKHIVGPEIIEHGVRVSSLMYSSGICWIGTTFGLIMYDTATGIIEKQYPGDSKDFSLGGENISNLYSDDSGNVWACTFSGGLRCWAPNEEVINRLIPSEEAIGRTMKGYISGKMIRKISGTKDGNIYIGSEEGYISRYNPETKENTDISDLFSIPYGTPVTGMIEVNNHLWISTYGDGILLFDTSINKVVKRYSLTSNDCLSILQTKIGDIFVATKEGLFKYNPKNDSFEFVTIVGKKFVHCLEEGRNNQLLMGFFSQGMGRLDIKKGLFEIESSIPQNISVSCIYTDAKGNLWIGTSGFGLYCIKSGSLEVLHCDFEGSLSNVVRDIIEDDSGTIWMSTSHGLVEFIPNRFSINKIYLQKDVITGNQFPYNSGYKSDDNTLYFGTNKGLISFNPDLLKRAYINKPILITNLKLIDSQTIWTLYKKPITINQQDASSLQINYSTMEYGNPNILEYECTLSSSHYNNQIRTINNSITYTNLRRGKYTFKVDYHGAIDNVNGDSLVFYIKAPWYSSVVAILFYILASISLIAFGLKKKRYNDAIKSKNRQELLNIQKEKNTANDKLRLLTNIAHEIRTPVSVIQIILEKLVDADRIPQDISSEFSSIKTNVDTLKRLCNELLDFRKMENGMPTMVMADEDLCKISNKVIDSFKTVAEKQNINLQFSIPEGPLYAHCDANSIESILCNLLSNAIKFCEQNIKYTLEASENCIKITVQNDGEIIAANEGESIFEAFYRCKRIKETAGSGLGLTYSRRIAEFHKGKLYYDIDCADCNSFVFEIPKKEKMSVKATDDNYIESTVNINKDRPTILVVEDNQSMRVLICEELAQDYSIVSAVNGKQALDIVRQNNIDLVVSDIMMPEMDGCELCNAIKEDIQLSHIPVLLLTAAVGVETHIKSLRADADAYFEKPFSMKVLRENILALFRNREIRNKQFSSSPLSHLSFSAVSKVEQEFMNNLHSFIMEHLEDSTLDLTKIAEAMNMSKPTLCRKIKAATDLTVSEYLRICRLKRAAELIAENQYRINEVAYLVGYSSPSYFTQSFQKQFGKLPSDLIKNN